MHTKKPKQQTGKPNVLILHCDQLRHDWLRCTGHPTIVTPNIDALAADGIVFSNHWAANTICTPSRASLMTGLCTHEHGAWTNGMVLSRHSHEPGMTDLYAIYDKNRADLQPPTIADIFHNAGYQTAAFGKMHLQPLGAPAEHGFVESAATWHQGKINGEWHGPYYGFEHMELSIAHADAWFFSSAGHYAEWLKEKDPSLIKAINDPKGAIYKTLPASASAIPHELHNTSWSAERFAAWLAASDPEKAFCGFIGFPGPHHPFMPSFDVIPRFEDWEDAGTDDDTGQFLKNSGAELFLNAHTGFNAFKPGSLESWDARAIPRKDIMLFRRRTTAMIWQIDDAVGRIVRMLKEKNLYDNTIIAFTSDHGDFLGNHGLLYKNLNGCRDLLQIPFILRAPNLKQGTDARIMGNTDVLPTLCALAGVKVPTQIKGIDCTSPRAGNHRAYACCDNVLHQGTERRLDNYSVMDGQYRYTYYPRAGFEELYDLRADPYECRNIAGEDKHRDLKAGLRQDLAEHMLHTSVPSGHTYSDY